MNQLSMIVIAPTDKTPQYLTIVTEAQSNATVGLCYHFVHFSLVSCLKGNTFMLDCSVICYPIDLISSVAEEMHHFHEEK